MSRNRSLARREWGPEIRLPMLEDDLDDIEEDMKKLQAATAKSLANNNRLLIGLLVSVLVGVLLLLGNVLAYGGR